MYFSYLDVYRIAYKVYDDLMKYKPGLLNFNVDKQEFLKWFVALVYQESRFDIYAKNPKSTATGLTQVLKATREETERKHLGIPVRDQNAMFEPEYAILIGMAYLGYLSNRPFTDKGDMKKIIVSYHDGSYTADGAGHEYYSLISQHYNEFQEQAKIAEQNFMIGPLPNEVGPITQVVTGRRVWK